MRRATVRRPVKVARDVEVAAAPAEARRVRDRARAGESEAVVGACGMGHLGERDQAVAQAGVRQRERA